MFMLNKLFESESESESISHEYVLSGMTSKYNPICIRHDS